MYSMDSAFYDAMRADTRDLDVFLAVGVNIDQTSADDFEGVQATGLLFSNADQLIDAVYNIEPGIATFEAYGIKTSVDAGMFAPAIAPATYPPEYGYWSDTISDGDGAIDWTFTVDLSAKHTSAFTVFTREVAIAEATVDFYADGTRTGGGAMTADRNSMKFLDAVEYDQIVVHVTKLEAPYRHARICEVEFGASKSFNKTSLAGSVSVISERDPTMQAIPLYELDFTVINVLGDWDSDNPSGNFADLPASYPVEVGVSCWSGATMWTVPLGRFIISEKQASETELTIVCYDPRKALQDTCESWTITADESLGAQITSLLEDLHVPHEVDADVFNITPEAYTSKADTSLLTVFLWIQQYYDVHLTPMRDGYVHVTKGAVTGAYGNMDKDMEYTWPLPYAFTKYNFIQVAYGPENSRATYTMDLRTSTSEVKSSLSVDNPMVQTLAKAQEVGARLRNALFSQMVEIEWRTDATLDIGDSVGLTGRWSDEPAVYDTVYQEVVYDGSLTARTRGIL